MIAVPRSVISIQSPWRQMPGEHLEVALAVAAAVGVAPEVDRHRRHRLGDHELADLADQRLALGAPRLELDPERAGLQLALVDGQRRYAADECGADVGAARGREQPDVLVGSTRRPTRTPRARAASRSTRPSGASRGRGPPTGAMPAFWQLAMKAALVPKQVMPASAARSQSTSQVGRAGVAVVEDDRGLARQRRDDEVPHHPAGGREPEQPVVGVQVDVEVHLLQHLDQDPAVAVHDRLRQSRRARAVEHPQRVIRRHVLEHERRPPRRGAAAPPSRAHRRGRRVAVRSR